jgi:hypothetical protein
MVKRVKGYFLRIEATPIFPVVLDSGDDTFVSLEDRCCDRVSTETGCGTSADVQFPFMSQLGAHFHRASGFEFLIKSQSKKVNVLGPEFPPRPPAARFFPIHEFRGLRGN